MKRYQIQYVDAVDLASGEGDWVLFYSAKSKRTLRGARKEWWRWVSHEWDFVGDRPLFRIWDAKEGKVCNETYP